MKTIKISLNSIDKVKTFVNVINRFDAEFDLVSGRYVIDAKSIMGIFSLDISKPIDLNIHNADNLDEIMEQLQPYLVTEYLHKSGFSGIRIYCIYEINRGNITFLGSFFTDKFFLYESSDKTNIFSDISSSHLLKRHLSASIINIIKILMSALKMLSSINTLVSVNLNFFCCFNRCLHQLVNTIIKISLRTLNYI